MDFDLGTCTELEGDRGDASVDMLRGETSRDVPGDESNVRISREGLRLTTRDGRGGGSRDESRDVFFRGSRDRSRAGLRNESADSFWSTSLGSKEGLRDESRDDGSQVVLRDTSFGEQRGDDRGDGDWRGDWRGDSEIEVCVRTCFR